MVKIDLKKVADLMNEVCKTNIDSSNLENLELFLNGNEVGIREKQNDSKKGEQKWKEH